MDGLRHQLLAAPGFTLDQHRGGRFRVQHDGLAHALHRLGLAAQVGQPVFGAQRIGHHVAPVAVGFELRQARQFQRVVKGLADRCGGVDEDAGQAGFFGQVGNQAGADDGLDARCLQVIDLRARIFFGGVGALFNRYTERGGEFRQRRHVVLVGDHADAVGDLAGAGQGLHEIEAAGLGDHHRYRQAAFQVSRVGAGSYHRIATLGREPFADMARRLVETEIDRFDIGQCVIFQRNVTEQFRQARDGNRPDHRLVGGVEGQGVECRMFHLKRFTCFNLKHYTLMMALQVLDFAGQRPLARHLHNGRQTSQ